MIEVYQTSVGWQFRMKVHGVTLLESKHYYNTKLQATRAVAALLRYNRQFERVIFLDENNRSITVDLSGAGND